jgi:hypothetical protein
MHQQLSSVSTRSLPLRDTFLLFLFLLGLAAAPAAAVQRRAFVTSVLGSGDLSQWPDANGYQGLEAGDAICQARAAAGGLPNPTAYRAWLSDAQDDAYCRVRNRSGRRENGCGGGPLPAAGPWYTVQALANFTADIDRLTDWDAEIYRPVIFDEFLHEIDNNRRYWTGTGPEGVMWEANCDGFRSASFNDSGTTGTTYTTTHDWTHSQIPVCSEIARLLCFETGASQVVDLHWSVGSIVFTTSTQGGGDLGAWAAANGQTGVAAGDEICREAAAFAHLPQPESFVAFLSDSAVEARDRLTSPGPWRRVDGYAVANSKADLLDSSPSNSFHVDEFGQYFGWPKAVWTGTNADGTRSALRCSDWTTNVAGVSSYAGRSSVGRDYAWTTSAALQPCNTPAALYCFSNTVTLFWDGFEITGDTSRWSRVSP